MNSSTQDPTGAGYQPDGSGAQQDHKQADDAPNPQDAQPQPNGDGEQQPKEGADTDDKQQGNTLAALVQNRQQARSQADQYQAQIAAMQQEIANLKAAQPAQQAPQEWKNPYNETDEPVDFLRAELQHTQAEMRELKQQGTKELEDTRSEQALNRFEAEVAQEISNVGTTTPELLAAYGFVSQQINNMHAGQGLSGQRLAQATRNSLLQSFVNGQTAGNSHAQTIAQMAINMGFKSKPAAPAKEDPVARGQKASGQSLGQATGTGGNTTQPTAQELTAMSTEKLKADGRAGLKSIKAMLKGEIPVE